MTEQLAFNVLVNDVNGSRNMKKFGEAVDDAGDSLKGMAKDSTLLTKQIDEVEVHLKELRTEFAKTGDLSLKKIISANERDLAFLQRIKKSLSEEPKKGWFGGVLDSLQALPAQLKGAGIAGLAGAGAAAAPLIGAAVAGAVLGGVGAGGIIGGITLAARDSRVEAAAGELAEQFMSGLQTTAQPFVGPVLDALERFEDTQRTVLVSLSKSFADLAPVVTPVAKGVDGFARNTLPGLTHAAAEARVPVRALANELPEMGDAVSDALDSISDESDNAARGVIGFSDAVEFGIRQTGEWIAYLGFLYGQLSKAGDAAHDAAKENEFLGYMLAIAGGPISRQFAEEMSNQEDALNAAKDASGDYAGSLSEVVDETERAREATIAYAESLEDQFDPTANLVHRLRDVKDAQKDYNEAVKEHGRDSRQAKDAELELASAILRAGTAAANAQGTFTGKLDPALRAILKTGGMTEAQLLDIERQFAAAQRAGERFAKTYTAQARIEFYEYRAGERNPDGRASGGPVAAGRTYWVGENGPELLTMGANGYILNAAQSKQLATGSAAAAAAGGGSLLGGGGRMHPADIEALARAIGGVVAASLGAANYATGLRADLLRRTG